MTTRVLLIGLSFLMLASGLMPQGTAPAYKNPGLPVEIRVDDLLARMTLEEKAAQVMCHWETDFFPIGPKVSEKGKLVPDKAKAVLGHGIGQMSDMAPNRRTRESAEFRNAVQKWVKENTRLGIPVLFHGEALHGYVAPGGTSFPQAIGLGSTWNPALVEEVLAVAAKEARRSGVQQVLAPVLDLGRDPRYGRIEETYSEDPYLAARLGVAAVRGFQGQGPGYDADHVIATAKHYVHGQPEGGTNIAPSQLSERVLRETFLYPFEMAVKEARIGSVMPSYNEIDGVPSHASKWLLEQVLRKEWGFQGFTVSDYFAVQQLMSAHHLAADPAGAGALALAAGVDVALPLAFGYRALTDLVRAGRLPEALLNQAVRRVLAAKFQCGLFENPFVDPDVTEKTVGNAEHGKLALRAAEEAIVLLKNEGGLLPLNRSKIKSLAVIGPNANKKRTGSYSGNPPYFVTVLDGVRKKLGESVQVVYAEGCRISVPDTGEPMMNFLTPGIKLPDPAEERKMIAEAVGAAHAVDAVLLVLGGNEAVSREAIGDAFGGTPHYGDADTLELPGVQNELADTILKLGKPTVTLLLNGRPYSTGLLAERAPAILEGWYLGQETGNAVANVLFGDVNPSGRLPVTIARNAGQLPFYYNHKPTARRGYIFSNKDPLFPFGHGLGYTTFRYGAVRIEPAKIPSGGTAVVSVAVTNAGPREGVEVVQLYIRDELSSVTRPVKELKGFQRVPLKPGETRTVRFEITPRTLEFFNLEMKRVVEPGAFEIMIGGSSAQTVSAKLVVE